MGKGSSFFDVFVIILSQRRIRPGSTVNTQSILINTPFASTTPISKPILNFINTSINRPTTVVKALLATEEKALTRAVFIASFLFE